MEGITNAHFTLGVRANVQPKSSNPIHAKIEISPKGFTIEIKVGRKTFHIAPSYK
jgi:hypothetical protein